jgi:hypothetical protein
MSAANELELESELSFLESEGEFELSGELEQELELANELASEFEMEHELEGEHEAFFNSLAAMADRKGRSQALRRIAVAAARSALRGQSRPWPVVEGELGEHEGEQFLGNLVSGITSLLGEGEGELEFEASPAQLSHVFAEMEHEGHAAAEAANEQEAAEHFLPLIGLAAKFVLPKLAGLAAKKLGGMALKKVGGKLIKQVGSRLIRQVAPRLINRVAPQLTRGVANITRTLFRNPSTRPLVHAVPRIARQTVARLGTQIARGRRITPQTAVRTLAQQTVRTIGNPRTLAQTYRRSLALDRRYHQRTRRILGRPAGSPVRANGTAGAPNQPLALNGAAGAPGTPYAPGMFAGGGAAAPAGCRCSYQPAMTAMPTMQMGAAPAMAMAPMQLPMPAPIAMSAPTCPACGR